MTGSRWRCFVAVPIGEDLRADLLATAEAWRGSEDLRWTDPDTWHVTLAFLGGIRAASIQGWSNAWRWSPIRILRRRSRRAGWGRSRHPPAHG